MVVLSDASVAGEGEHKISAHIPSMRGKLFSGARPPHPVLHYAGAPVGTADERPPLVHDSLGDVDVVVALQLPHRRRGCRASAAAAVAAIAAETSPPSRSPYSARATRSAGGPVDAIT